MSFREEIVSSVYGAWRIARFDPAAMRYFNLSIEGFWRSFAAAAIVAPFFLIGSVMTRPADDASANAAGLTSDGDIVGFLFLRLVIYAVNWAAFPLLMIPLARILGLSATYVPYIIAWNWSNVLVNALWIPASIAFGIGLLQTSGGSMVMMALFICIVFYGYLVTRAALGCAMPMAIGLVIFDTLLNVLIGAGAEQFFYSPAVPG
jgi:hypothetical protein